MIIEEMYWLTGPPIDEWEKWTPILDCERGLAEKAMELFIKGSKEFTSKIDWELQRYILYVFEDPFAVAFKGLNNGTANVFTEARPHLHNKLYHEYGCEDEWEISGTAHTEKTLNRIVKFT